MVGLPGARCTQDLEFGLDEAFDLNPVGGGAAAVGREDRGVLTALWPPSRFPFRPRQQFMDILFRRLGGQPALDAERVLDLGAALRSRPCQANRGLQFALVARGDIHSSERRGRSPSRNVCSTGFLKHCALFEKRAGKANENRAVLEIFRIVAALALSRVRRHCGHAVSGAQ